MRPVRRCTVSLTRGPAAAADLIARRLCPYRGNIHQHTDIGLTGDRCRSSLMPAESSRELSYLADVVRAHCTVHTALAMLNG